MATLLIMCWGGAKAANTASGTTISNTASVDYQVSGVSQATITSVADTFVVDSKVNITVATVESAVVSVTPGTNNNVLRFSVTNSGNTVQDFSLTATALSGTAAKFGGTDNKDATTVAVYADVNGNGTYESATDTATYIDELTSGSSKTVFVVSNFANSGFANNDIAAYHLTAQARAGGGAAVLGGVLTEDTGSADTASTVQIVFADGVGSNDISRDAKMSDYADYKIATAGLTVSKSSAVISDPFNNTTNPKRIPGAVIEYTITISNAAGASTATSIAVTDDLSTEISAGRLAFNLNTYAAGKGIQVTSPNLYSGAATALTNGSDADEGTWTAGTSILAVTGISLSASQSATVKFQVTVQ